MPGGRSEHHCRSGPCVDSSRCRPTRDGARRRRRQAWWRPRGSTRGVPATGSSMTRQSRPNTSSTISAVTTSRGAPWATRRPSFTANSRCGVAGGEVEVVEDHHDRRPALAVEIEHQVEHVDLVGDVEEGRRLVEEQDVGALGERHRDPHALTLSAGQLVHGPVGEVRAAGRAEGLRDGFVVGGAPPAEAALVRVAAAADEIRRDDPLGRDRRLRQQRELLGDASRRDVADRRSAEQHGARRSARGGAPSCAAASTSRWRSRPR